MRRLASQTKLCHGVKCGGAVVENPHGQCETRKILNRRTDDVTVVI